MDKLTADLQCWLDNSEEEVFFYLRNNWPLFKRRDELRLELDDGRGGRQIVSSIHPG